MQSLRITIEDENVSINQDCSNDNFMLATSVMLSSMVQGSDQTIEELVDILKANALSIIDKSSLKLLEVEEELT
jgi:hypothetical protein